MRKSGRSARYTKRRDSRTTLMPVSATGASAARRTWYGAHLPRR